MLNALQQPELIFDKAVIEPSRRLSDFIVKIDSYRQNMTSLSSLDTTSVNDTTSNNDKEKKQKRVHFGKRTLHAYSPEANDVPKEELWYSMSVLEQKLKEDLTELRRANHRQMFSNRQLMMKRKSTGTARSNAACRRLQRRASSNAMTLEVKEISTRGLEKYVQNTSVHHRRVSQVFVRSVVEQYQREQSSQLHRTPSTSAHTVGNRSKPRRQGRCGQQQPSGTKTRRVSAISSEAQEAAFRLACEDEVAARRIYLEDGIVVDSVVFAAKRKSSLRAKATMAAMAASRPKFSDTSDVRRSYVAKSA